MANNGRPKLTSEKVVLTYLSRNQATHREIAAALARMFEIQASHHPSTKAILARLHHRGEVVKLPAKNGWCISAKGKKTLAAEEDQPESKPGRTQRASAKSGSRGQRKPSR